MKWNVVRLHGLDRLDVSGVVHLKMHRSYVYPVSWAQALFENIVIFLKNVISKVSTFLVFFA